MRPRVEFWLAAVPAATCGGMPAAEWPSCAATHGAHLPARPPDASMPAAGARRRPLSTCTGSAVTLHSGSRMTLHAIHRNLRRRPRCLAACCLRGALWACAAAAIAPEATCAGLISAATSLSLAARGPNNVTSASLTGTAPSLPVVGGLRNVATMSRLKGSASGLSQAISHHDEGTSAKLTNAAPGLSEAGCRRDAALQRPQAPCRSLSADPVGQLPAAKRNPTQCTGAPNGQPNDAGGDVNGGGMLAAGDAERSEAKPSVPAAPSGATAGEDGCRDQTPAATGAWPGAAERAATAADLLTLLAGGSLSDERWVRGRAFLTV